MKLTVVTNLPVFFKYTNSLGIMLRPMETP